MPVLNRNCVLNLYNQDRNGSHEVLKIIFQQIELCLFKQHHMSNREISNIHGPKVTVQRFGLIARSVII